ncbi:queuosine 5'-phosphate N-glycosylase/hydrolase-like isoform X2 [Linepithema humile]|uniref:queuosine 5'-phosphate N-glycosylase/hydrolase-like isoform X2 n=1 Tax=Linepithema humile TaxID=83485 RepID=UPI0006237DCB|nr:PREDICTED: UPF0553 protein C9orf64-like isoform X2 [Linepithema humile]
MLGIGARGFENRFECRDAISFQENLEKVLMYLDEVIQNGANIERVTSKFTRYYLYPDINDDTAADWIFVLHTLNFSLWSPKGTDPWTVKGFTGFLALCAAMERAIMEGKPVWNPKYYKELFQKPEDVEIFFRSDNGTCIPMLKERLDLLHEIGNILIENYEGTFLTCVKLCKKGNDLLKLLINFPSYHENMLQYKGKRVIFYLKATTLMIDLLCFFSKHKAVKIEATFGLSSMLIDFRVIQIFLNFNALSYSDRLQKKIEENDTLEFESTENLEIIACACVIRSQLRVKFIELCEMYKIMNPDKKSLIEEIPFYKYNTLIDNFLWDFRYVHDEYLMKNVLLHNVRSVYF